MAERRKKECSLWSGSDNIPEAFAALPDRSDVPIATYLSRKRVVVRNDPALAAVFGPQVVQRYESMLAEAADGG